VKIVEHTLSSISRIVGGEITGNGSTLLKGVATLEKAGPSDISFLANMKYLRVLEESGAGAIICPEKIESPGKNLLRVKNPYLVFGKVVELFHPPGEDSPGVHPTAILGKGVTLEKNVSIGPLVFIGEKVSISTGAVVGPLVFIGDEASIGEKTRVGPRVTIYHGVRIGKRSLVQAGSVLGSDGFGFVRDEDGHHRKIPQVGGLRIGNDVEIGSNCTIDRGSLGDTIIADGTKFDNQVHVAHNVEIGEDTLLVAQVGISGSTKIGKNVVLAGQAGVTGHIEIGDGAMVAAQAGVDKSVKPGEVVSGYPARPHRKALKTLANMIKIPAMKERIKVLEERVKKLENLMRDDKSP
jgi:UDP-3-O-[3-hydroxymyristoyl] glucosamine N-acyltransferase